MALFLYLLGITFVTFLLYGLDKREARRGARRVPESGLLLAGFLGGTLGALAGMRFFRHKTKKRPFLIKFWVLTVLQLGLVLFPPPALQTLLATFIKP